MHLTVEALACAASAQREGAEAAPVDDDDDDVAVVLAAEDDEGEVSAAADAPLRCCLPRILTPPPPRGAREDSLEKWYSIRRSLGGGLIISCRCVASMASRVIGGTGAVNVAEVVEKGPG